MNKTPIKTQELIELMGKSITVGEKVYVPTKITYFEDGITFNFDVRTLKKDGKSTFKKETFHFDYPNADRLLPVSFEGVDFFWDKPDEVFRWLPREPREESLEVNPWMITYDNGELLVEKAFAEAHFSTYALAYAFEVTDAHYSFNLSDYSYTPLLYECPRAFKDFLNSGTVLDPNFDNMFKYVSFYAADYCETVNPNPDMEKLCRDYLNRFYTKLKTPEGEY